MKRYSTLALLTAIISIGAQAMDNIPGTLAAAGAGAAGGGTGAGQHEQSLAGLTAQKETKDMGIQATSDFPLSPSQSLNQFRTRAFGYSVAAGALSTAVGFGASAVADRVTRAVLPARLSQSARNGISGIVSLGTYFATAFYTVFKLQSFLDKQLVPGDIPVGTDQTETRAIIRYRDTDGQEKTRIVYFHVRNPHFYIPDETDDETDTAQ